MELFDDEGDLVRAFGSLLHAFPRNALSPGARELLILGNELRLPGGSTTGGHGSLDLLAVDDLGEVWLIEAKLRRNPQRNPWYLFGRQLTAYAEAVTRVGLQGIHRHLQEYAFGRRPRVTPPAALADRWLGARTLADMLRPWLAGLGGDRVSPEELVAVIGGRLSSGQFLLAALVDSDDGTLARWGSEFQDDFQTAVIVVGDGTVEVPFRTPWRKPVTGSDTLVPLPPFGRIPQSYKLTPASAPLVLNETALRLWYEVIEPELAALVGPIDEARCYSNAISFGYCLPSVHGPPFFLRIGRGDHRVHRGTDAGAPGSHAVKVDIVFKWACSELLKLGPDEAQRRQATVDSMYRLCHALVFRAGYRLKATDHGTSVTEFNRQFLRGLSARTLLVERGGLKHGVRDFGVDPDAYKTDAAVLGIVFEELKKQLPPQRPLMPIRKPQRRGDYGEGRLEDCRPSIDLTHPG